MKALEVNVWSDIACPWCWVGKRRLEAAITAFDGDVSIRWRAFELDPNASKEPPETVDYASRLAVKYRTDRAGGQEMIDRMTAVGRSEGLDMRFDRVRPASTFDAHRLLVWAARSNRQTDLKERLLAAYLSEGMAISDHGVLVDLVADVGLDPDDALVMLGSDAHSDEVREDQALASRLGIGAVPFFVFDHRYAVAGAQGAEELLAAMRQAVAEAPAAIPGR